MLNNIYSIRLKIHSVYMYTYIYTIYTIHMIYTILYIYTIHICIHIYTIYTIHIHTHTHNTYIFSPECKEQECVTSSLYLIYSQIRCAETENSDRYLFLQLHRNIMRRTLRRQSYSSVYSCVLTHDTCHNFYTWPNRIPGVGKSHLTNISCS